MHYSTPEIYHITLLEILYLSQWNYSPSLLYIYHIYHSWLIIWALRLRECIMGKTRKLFALTGLSSILAPGAANLTGNLSVDIFAISTTEIVVAAGMNNIVANSGNMGQYKLVSVSPNLTSGTNPLQIEPNPADSDANMTIGNLFPGTSYNLTFVNTMQLCNSTRDSETTTVTHVCTSW